MGYHKTSKFTSHCNTYIYWSNREKWYADKHRLWQT